MFDPIKSFLIKTYSGFLNCDISLFHRFHRPPYGGSNQFFLALKKELISRNYRVKSNCMGKDTKGVIINSFAFDKRLLRKSGRKGCTIIHRVVGPVALYRGTKEDDADRKQWEANAEFADVTVFQSNYSLKAHDQLGISFKSPVVIMNAVDPEIFFPAPKPKQIGQGKIKLIATSWSNHPNKGIDTYQWLDQNLDWDRYQFTFLGHIRARFKNIQMLPPVPSQRLAEFIRSHDIYITASLHETCSNALLEALACHLPAIYADSGGHREIVKEAGLGFTRKEQIPLLLEQLISEYDDRKSSISIPILKDVVDRYMALVNFHGST